MKAENKTDPYQDLIHYLPQPWPEGLKVYTWPPEAAEKAEDFPVGERLFFVSEDVAPEQVLTAALNQGVSHLCQLGNPFSPQEMLTASLMLNRPEEVLDKPFAAFVDPQSFDKVSEEDCIDFEGEFDSINDKSPFLQSLEEFLAQQVPAASLRSDVLSIVDELYTNVIFNAPFVSEENLNPKVERTMDASLPPVYPKARLKMAIRESQITLGCEDFFGALPIPNLLSKVLSCYQKGIDASMNMGVGGAGIGSYMIFEASASYSLLVQPGQKTLIICRLPAKMSQRSRQALSKNIHFLQGTKKEKK